MSKAKIYYHDIGDYLNQEEKLKIISQYKSFSQLPMTELQPNEHGDWISMRNDNFDNFIFLEPTKKFDLSTNTFFNTYAVAVNTGRDAWCYSFSKMNLSSNVQSMIDFYNSEVDRFVNLSSESNTKLNVENIIDSNPEKISWTRSLRNDVAKNIHHSFADGEIRISSYRPFCKQQLYFSKSFNEAIGLSPKLFPNTSLKNVVICVSPSPNDGLSLLISKEIANLHFNGDTQCFPLYYYEENKKEVRIKKGKNAETIVSEIGFDEINDGKGNLICKDGVSDFILAKAQTQYQAKNISKEDIFYYVYGVLHSKEYRETFANDLKKMLPRLPLVTDVKEFWAFSKAGRALADLHLNYETVPPYKEAIILFNPLSITDTLSQANKEELEYLNYRVDKMRFPKKGQKETIIYNNQITIDNIPAKAYEYIVNGKSAIDWIMERYQITTHKESGIKNDPNDWALEHNQPRYILDLLLSVINVSVQTVDIVNGLPKMSF